MSQLDFAKYYKSIAKLDVISETPTELRARCPFHDDEKPSFSANKETGLWKCFGGCQASGNIYQFHVRLREQKAGEKISISKAKKEIEIGLGLYLIIDHEYVERCHKALLVDEGMKKFLIEERGLTLDTINHFELGLDGPRVTIPVYDTDGYVVNVRKYLPNAKRSQDKMLSYATGYGESRLYPIENMTASDILLVEGELDALIATQHGFPAVTATTGAGHFPDKVVPFFHGKVINICFDIDDAGKEGAQKVARKLAAVAGVRIMELPITEPKNGDITDFFVRHQKTKDDFTAAIKAASPYTGPIVPTASVKDDTVYDVSLDEAAKSEYYYKKTRMNVIVAGKDLAPYFAPIKVRLSCPQKSAQCKSCNLHLNNGKMLVTFTASNHEILQLINCTEAKQQQIIRKKARIPDCAKAHIEVEDIINIEEVRVIPEIHFAAKDAEYVTRQVYVLGYGIKTNRSYVLTGVTVPDPQTQYATQIIVDAQPTQSSIEKFNMTPEIHERLKIFQTDDITKKIGEINKDLTSNVTKIYGRPDLITAADLIYHSVLQFNFQGQLIKKGWADGLIIGDTRCGKTESLIQLIGHYRLGELCTGENISYAGLVGGMSQAQQRWSISWGKIPLNDKRLIVLDEVSSLDVDTISNLSALRSSGVAEIIKIQTERTNARTRLIWVSNPRSGRKLDTYNYGVLAIKELIGRVEDIARFDFAIAVAASDVPMDEINKETHEQVEHKYTSDLCHMLLVWTWSRQPDQIKFTKGAVDLILKKAIEFGEKYSPSIPLVEGAEQRIKLAKLAVAIAARTFSTEDGQNLIVKKEHVKFIVDYLDKIYSKPAMGYDIFSLAYKQTTSMTSDTATKLAAEFREFPSADLLRNLFLEYQAFRKTELIDQLGYDLDDSRKLFKWLTKNRLIKSTPVGYIKQPTFTEFLKGLPDETGEEDNQFKY